MVVGIHNWSASRPFYASIRLVCSFFMFAIIFCNLILRFPFDQGTQFVRSLVTLPTTYLSLESLFQMKVWQTRREHLCVNIKSRNFSSAREIFYKWSKFASLKRDKFIPRNHSTDFSFWLRCKLWTLLLRTRCVAVQRVVAKKALKVVVRNFNSFIRQSAHLEIGLRAFRPIRFTRKIRGLADGHTRDLRFKSRLFRGGSWKATIDEIISSILSTYSDF